MPSVFVTKRVVSAGHSVWQKFFTFPSVPLDTVVGDDCGFRLKHRCVHGHTSPHHGRLRHGDRAVARAMFLQPATTNDGTTPVSERVTLQAYYRTVTASQHIVWSTLKAMQISKSWLQVVSPFPVYIRYLSNHDCSRTYRWTPNSFDTRWYHWHA